MWIILQAALRAGRKKFGYIEERGVNYLHLMTILNFPEGRNDGGYEVVDSHSVQPELGTMEDIEELCTECRERVISVCLDFVMNHSSEAHEWAKRAKAGDWEYQNCYYFYDNYDIQSMYENEKTVPQVFPTTAPRNLTYNHETGKFVMTTFYPYQWDLNYHNPIILNR